MRSAVALILTVTAASAATTSCVLLPIPSSEAKPATVGRALRAQDLASVVPLRTSREEVIAKLGEPGIDLVGLRILAYPWTALKRTSLVLSLGAGGIEESERTALFVALDHDDKVVKAGFDHPTGSDGLSMVTWARRWAAANGVALPPGEQGYVPAPVPDGRGLVDVYRAPPAASSLGFLTRARFPEAVGVAVDDRFVAELLDEEYVSIVLPAGPHTISVHPAPPYRYKSESSDARQSPSVHTSTVTIDVKGGGRYFLESVATLARGLSYDTSIGSLTQAAATQRMVKAHSIW